MTAALDEAIRQIEALGEKLKAKRTKADVRTGTLASPRPPCAPPGQALEKEGA